RRAPAPARLSYARRADADRHSCARRERIHPRRSGAEARRWPFIKRRGFSMTRFRHCRSALLLAPLLTLTACGKTGAPDAAERADAVATVNGEAVTRSEFDLYLDNISQQSGRDVPEEQKSLLLDQ